MSDFAKMTQTFASWGDKLLQHTDVLHSMQVDRVIKPITIQLAPIEICGSDCPFCSVAARPVKNFMPFDQVKRMLDGFKTLGAKSLELSGGGNPMLYTDREAGKDINDIIAYGFGLGFSVAMITNSSSFKRLRPETYDMLDWIRVSLIKLDEGVDPEWFDFCGFPDNKISFSYILYDKIENPYAHTNRVYEGTTPETIAKIKRLVELHPDSKFVRFAGNCLVKGNNQDVKDRYGEAIQAIDQGDDRYFIKDIGLNDGPFDDGCYIGLVRPYIASDPDGVGYQVYTCSSFVLEHQTYNWDHALGSVDDVVAIWAECNERFQRTGYPYEVKGNGGKGWCATCKFCFYQPNNRVLHTVVNEMPDRNFA